MTTLLIVACFAVVAWTGCTLGRGQRDVSFDQHCADALDVADMVQRHPTRHPPARVMTAVATRGAWAMPDARIVLPADAPRGEWLQKRRRGIGGSDASTVVGVNKWSSRYELWLDKTGQLPPRQTSPRMEAGTRLEPVMRQWFADETGIVIRRQGLVQSRQRPWQMVSLDGLTGDGGIFESKATNWRLADEWEGDQVADHAEVQAQHGSTAG